MWHIHPIGIMEWWARSEALALCWIIGFASIGWRLNFEEIVKSLNSCHSGGTYDGLDPVAGVHIRIIRLDSAKASLRARRYSMSHNCLKSWF